MFRIVVENQSHNRCKQKGHLFVMHARKHLYNISRNEICICLLYIWSTITDVCPFAALQIEYHFDVVGYPPPINEVKLTTVHQT